MITVTVNTVKDFVNHGSKRLATTDLDTIGQRLRWMIEEHLRVKHAAFARTLGVKPPQLSRWINDSNAPPSEDSTRFIAETAGVPFLWLRHGVVIRC